MSDQDRISPYNINISSCKKTIYIHTSFQKRYKFKMYKLSNIYTFLFLIKKGDFLTRKQKIYLIYIFNVATFLVYKHLN